jgi:4-hydroxybenzoate polyprenyltransferase
MLEKIKFFYDVFKWNRTVYTSIEFVLAYVFWIYLFSLNFNLNQFLLYYFMYLVAFGLVYPIVYIYNDITDVEKDKLNKKRLKYKPLAAWKISLNDFLAYGILWIWIWLMILSFAPNIFIFFLGLAIFFNFFYTKYLKHIFMIENFANAVTHSFVRFPLWLLLAFWDKINFLSVNDILVIVLLILAHFVVLSLGATYKRYLEFKMWNKTRKTLENYSLNFFYKSFITFNLVYIITILVLLYLKFDYLLFFIGIFVFFLWNLALLWWKSKFLDEIIIRLYAW